jgi:hypothetical protein
MWIVFGTAERTERVPGGAKVDRRCEKCGEVTTFYEKQVHSSFRLYFIDVFDYDRHRVMACGGCGTCYATDELGSKAAAEAGTEPAARSFGQEVERVARRAGGFLERTADAVEAGISSLLPGDSPHAPARREPDASEHADGQLSDEEEQELDPLEKRFRDLEERDKPKRVRIE